MTDPPPGRLERRQSVLTQILATIGISAAVAVLVARVTAKCCLIAIDNYVEETMKDLQDTLKEVSSCGYRETIYEK